MKQSYVGELYSQGNSRVVVSIVDAADKFAEINVYIRKRNDQFRKCWNKKDTYWL